MNGARASRRPAAGAAEATIGLRNTSAIATSSPRWFSTTSDASSTRQKAACSAWSGCTVSARAHALRPARAFASVKIRTTAGATASRPCVDAARSSKSDKHRMCCMAAVASYPGPVSQAFAMPSPSAERNSSEDVSSSRRSDSCRCATASSVSTIGWASAGPVVGRSACRRITRVSAAWISSHSGSEASASGTAKLLVASRAASTLSVDSSSDALATKLANRVSSKRYSITSGWCSPSSAWHTSGLLSTPGTAA
mmetsp:Transcript_37499/g.115799  ORF Transcript_37499/g.115799 Transcript_37499/m.115799 type:complete len:254 (-) Transcript_37499:724-1485(-)